MGLYDREVKDKLGEKVVTILCDEATKRNINSQHFEDLSAMLHPNVRGNHLRRVHELRRVCDEAEMRDILSVGHSRLYNSFFRKGEGFLRYRPLGMNNSNYGAS